MHDPRLDDDVAVRSYEPADRDDVIDAYRMVWTTDPWNEVFGEQAATDQLDEALSTQGSTVLVAEGETDDPADGLDLPADPAYLLADDEEPPTDAQFFSELGEPDIMGFTWALPAGSELDTFPDDDGFRERLSDDSYYVSELGVVPGYRSQGIGSGLSAALMTALEEQGTSQAVLRTNPAAEKAVNLYEQLGFERTDYTDPVYDERIYLFNELGDPDGG